MRRFVTCTLDRVKENERDKEWGMYGEKRNADRVLMESQKKETLRKTQT
jgi:hypothetical protein